MRVFRDRRGWCCVVLALLAGCASEPPKKAVQVPTPQANVAPIFRGLIASEVEFRNTTPILVSGYGLVVSLNGTGGQPLNDQIAASMERQLGLMGVGRSSDALKGTALEGMSPAQVLRDKNVAVVQVLAALPPGAADGSTFDVVVRAVNASSLEGGRLWTTDLRIGPPTAFGQSQAKRLAVARGSVYTNPFAMEDPASTGYTGAAGRILGGGQVVDSQNVVLDLLTPSHARARSIVSSINSRYPAETGDRGPVARGRSDTRVEVEIPERFRRDPRSFLAVVQNLQIDQGSPEQYARRYVEMIKSDPQMGERLSWALEGLGDRALPQIRELYDFPELAPQLAGLKAGARLNDARTVPFLRDVIRKSQGAVRTEAIALLGKVDAGARVDATLRDLLNDKELIVRITTYEALADRAERAQFVYLARLLAQNRDIGGPDLTPQELDLISRETLPAGLMQGVQRQSMYGKFLFDKVDGGTPLIYVTQQGLPRIVVFGQNDDLRLNGVISVWGGRLLLAAGDKPGDLKVQYLRTGSAGPVTTTIRATLTELITALARKSSADDPRPGMDLSYAQIVATLAKIQEAGGTSHAFATEQDRLRMQLAAAENSRDMLERPETPDDKEPIMVRRGVGEAGTPEADEKPKVVPIQ